MLVHTYTSMTKITLAKLKEYLNYNPDTGDFIWIKRKNPACKMNEPLITKRSDGYYFIRFDRTSYVLHRLAWFYMTGRWPKNEIDHINHIRTDNRWCNLREATRQQQTAASSFFRNNTSGYRGVIKIDWSKQKPWYARIKYNQEQIVLGTFPTKEEAALAYNIKAKELFGEYAYQNVIAA